MIRKKRTSVVPFQLSPAHVRDPLVLIVREFSDTAFQQAQPLGVAFITPFKQQLETQANAEQRTILCMPLLQRGNQF